jgi:hypothetical protein
MLRNEVCNLSSTVVTVKLAKVKTINVTNNTKNCNKITYFLQTCFLLCVCVCARACVRASARTRTRECMQAWERERDKDGELHWFAVIFISHKVSEETKSSSNIFSIGENKADVQMITSQFFGKLQEKQKDM